MRIAMFSAALAVAAATAGAAEPASATQPSGLSVQGSWFRPHTATAYVYVRNTTDKPLTLQRLKIDGQIEQADPWPLDPRRKAHWFDFIPATVPPQAVAQVRVNLRQANPNQGIVIEVEADSGASLSATVTPTAPELFFTDITFAKDGASAALFVGGADFRIERVLMDGQDVTDRCDLSGGESFADTAIVTLRPAKPLVRGSYHVYEVYAADGRAARYAAHTLANDFILGTYGNTEHFDAYREDGLNNYVCFRNLNLDDVKRLASLGMTAAPVPFVGGQFSPKTKAWVPFDPEKSRQNIEAVKASGAVAFYAGSDEPDGYDSMAKNLGLHGRIIVAQRQLAEQVDPATPSFIQIDNSLKPHNYHVYAETMDYSSTHRYNLGQEFLPGDRQASAELRLSSQPQPYLWVTQLYPVRAKEGERVAYNGRNPLPGEMHLQMLEALANGAKGVVHYIYSGSTGGRGGSGIDDPKLWASMKPMHQQLAAAGALVVRSTPTTWAQSSDAQARAVALLADRSNLLLVLTNQAVTSTKTDFEVPALKNVAVTVAIPSWVTVNEAVEITPGGQLRPVPLDKQTNQIVLTAETLDVGTLFWLRGGQSK